MSNPSPTLPPTPSTIANLPAVPSVTTADFIPISQNGVTYKGTAGQFASIVSANSIVGGNGITVSTTGGVSTITNNLYSLTNGDIFVGNASNVATAVAVSGDATLSNTGALTLDTVNSNVGSFTNASVTVNAKGLVTAASSGAAPAVVYNAISGYLCNAQSFSTNTSCACNVTAGQAADSTNTVYITSSVLTWNVVNGNAIGGYQGGTTLPNSTTIHFFVCQGASGIGTFASLSESAPTLPSGYNTSFRRVFSLNTNASGVLLAGTPIEISGGAVLYWLATQILDISVTNQSTTKVLYTLSAPAGIKVQPLYRANSATNSQAIILTSGDETDIAPTTGTQPGEWITVPGADFITPSASGFSGGGASFPRDGLLTTNTSGQIGARASASSTSFYWVTRGWIDFRRS
jgi:hypothetical protein